MDKFTIEFPFNGISYKGMVTPKMENGIMYYSVQLESENQDNYLEIVASPPSPDTGYWKFIGLDKQEPPKNYDEKLLQEIGEAIEKHEITSAG